MMRDEKIATSHSSSTTCGWLLVAMRANAARGSPLAAGAEQQQFFARYVADHPLP